MVATPLSVNMIFKQGSAVLPYTVSVSDVANEAAIFSDGQDLLTLPGGIWIFSDAVCSGAGADTKKLEIFASQKSSGEYIFYNQNQLTTIGRQFQSGPRKVRGGIPLRFVQRV